jgi:hypothetical protein
VVGEVCGGSVKQSDAVMGWFYLSFSGRKSFIKLKKGLYVPVCVSLICRFSLLRLYMWKHSSVFISGPFFSMCRMSVVLSICVVCLGCVYSIWS